MDKIQFGIVSTEDEMISVSLEAIGRCCSIDFSILDLILFKHHQTLRFQLRQLQ